MTTPKYNGIYFIQKNMKKEGFYYTEDEKGNSIYNKYKDPSFIQKLGNLILGKKDFRDEPKSTSYWLFIENEDKIFLQSGSQEGDSVSVAQSLKRTSYSSDNFEIFRNEEGNYFFNANDFTITFIFKENGYSLIVHNKNEKTLQIIKQNFNFLDWTNL